MTKFKVSIIHPSRGRPSKALQTTGEWLDRIGDVHWEYILSCDADDSTLPQYDKLSGAQNARRIVNNNRNLVEATNQAARLASGDIILYLSDDFRCPYDWGKLLEKEFEGDKQILLKVDDCLQKFHVPVLTIPIMSFSLYKQLGYFFHPDFYSMHCDEHLYARCMKLGVIKFAPHLKFPHDHVSIGKAQDDETYRRSAANWNHGVMMINKHRRLGFTE